MRKLKLLIAACALLSAAAMQAKTDVTSTYLTNANLTTVDNGWTYYSDTYKYQNWRTGSETLSAAVEFYAGWSSLEHTNFKFSQTVTLPAGYYRIAVNAFFREGNNGDGTNNNKAWIFAGDQTQNVYGLASGALNNWSSAGDDMNKAMAAFHDGEFSNEFDFSLSEETEISLGFEGCFDAIRQWCILGPVSLYEYTAEDYIEDYDTKYATAEGLIESIMNADVLSALQEAMVDRSTLTTVDQVKSAITTLNTAIINANNSITAYTSAKAYLDKMGGVLENTNVYTEEAYNQYYGTWLSDYNARTMTDAVASTLSANIAYSTGWHSSNNIDDVLLSTWSIDNVPCANYDLPLYINTWSTEGNTDGSEFYTPFFEYWVASGSLDAKTFTSTMTGLTANTTYSFTIRARVQGTTEKVANSITLKVGEGDAVDIGSGTQFGTTNFYIGNFSAVGQTDADGNLTTTITVAANSNISWLSFYNCKVTEGEDLSAYIADYEFALSTATANKSNAAYAAVTGKEKSDLEDALATYADVDETDKAALIAAKDALETASNTFVAAAATYNAFAELNANVAETLEVALPTITSETTAADLKIEEYIVAEYDAAKAAYAQDYTDKLSEWTDAPGTNMGESWDGSTTDTYYDLYNTSDVKAMTQEVTLPAGYYALIAKGRASVNGRLTLTDGTETVTFPHKSSTGRGIATDGTATFAEDATYANNNNGRGWEYRVLTFTSDGVTPTELTFNWTTASSNWCGLDDIELLCNPVTVTSAYLAGSFNEWKTTDLEMTQVGETNSYSCELDIEDLADVTFKPVINGNWMAYSDFTMDESNPAGWLEDAGDSNNHNIKLNNSTTGYKTYTVTATWTPSLDVTAGWTLKIEGKDERPKNTYTVNFVKGWSDWSTVYAYAWNDNGNVTDAWPGNEMTASTDTKYGYTIYTLSFDSYTAPTKVQFNDGTNNHKIDNLDFTDGMTYEGVTFEDFTVTEAGWATAITKHAVDFTDVDGLKAYTATVAEGKVTLAEAGAVPAGTALVLKGATKAVPVVESAKAVTNDLKGSNEYDFNINDDMDAQYTFYGLTVKNSTAQFVKLNKGTIQPGKAYLKIEKNASGDDARELKVVFAGEATGIDAIVAEKSIEGIYNMNGQRVAAPAKGLYIVNGKKVILK